MVSESGRSPRSSALPSTFCAVVAERRLLSNLAYCLLDSVDAAEVAVQETYTRWYTMPDEEQGRIDRPLTWLVGTLVRICVDRRESSSPHAGGRAGDPAGRPDPAGPTPRRFRAWRDVPKL
ncbi:sigma factor [Micromonospora musae]|uniref:sigma factor n=1 Tax=Micromonospora musae TaxID=1894970 RepID=UPI0033DF18D0